MQKILLIGMFLAAAACVATPYNVNVKLSDQEQSVLRYILEHTELPETNLTVDDIMYAVNGEKTQTQVKYLNRFKRALRVASDTFCCQTEEPSTYDRAIIKIKLVSQSVERECGTSSCGFLGLFRCPKTCSTTVPVPMYYTEIVKLERRRGCPVKKIACCNPDRLYYKGGRACITWDQWKELILLLSQLGLLEPSTAQYLIINGDLPPLSTANATDTYDYYEDYDYEQ